MMTVLDILLLSNITPLLNLDHAVIQISQRGKVFILFKIVIRYDQIQFKFKPRKVHRYLFEAFDAHQSVWSIKGDHTVRMPRLATFSGVQKDR